MKNCLYCGTEINFGNAKRKFCSDNCRTKFYQRKKGLIKSRNKVCKNCGKSFYDDSKNNRMVHCSSICEQRFNYPEYTGDRVKYVKKYNKKYYNENKEELSIKQKVYISKVKNTDRHRKMRIDSTNRYINKYPKKHKAHQIFNSYKNLNPELFLDVCSICGASENIEYHHPDYNFPLSVIPLCLKHHKELHKNEVVFS